MIDAHCHLYDAADVAQQMYLYERGGVACVSEDLTSLERSLALAEQWPGVIYVGGALHPAHSVTITPLELDKFFARLEEVHSRLDLVGESGLDYKYAVTPEQRQLQGSLLQRHFDFAARHRLPVNLHSRRAERAVVEAALEFRSTTGLNALLHWFTSSRKLIRHGAAGGLFFSAGPVILEDENSFRAACSIPLELLLTETDAPVPFTRGGGRLEAVKEVTEKLALYHEMSLSEFELVLRDNFRSYLADPAADTPGAES
ncbi:MAG: TatD family hydrolase [Candidatus Delongbacteria bacterium]|nr:TatD family hydrolase [Candidatus Delongbacteria bacterium]